MWGVYHVIDVGGVSCNRCGGVYHVIDVGGCMYHVIGVGGCIM